jgi:hypothetical protein
VEKCDWLCNVRPPVPVPLPCHPPRLPA